MGRNDHVHALDEQGDDAAGGEQQQRAVQGVAQGALFRRQCGPVAQDAPEQVQPQRDTGDAAAVLHQARVTEPRLTPEHRMLQGEDRHVQKWCDAQGEQHDHRARGEADGQPRRAAEHQPAEDQQLGMGELQHVAGAPEQKFEVAVRIQGGRQFAQGPQEHQQGQRCSQGGGETAETQSVPGREGRAPVQAATQSVDGQQAEAGADEGQRQQKGRMLQHRQIVVHQWRPHAGKGQNRHQQAAGGTQQQGERVQARTQRQGHAPEHAREGHEPDEHRHVHVHHQCRAKEVDPGNDRLHAGRARQNQQNGEQAGDDQGGNAEPQPAQCKRAGRRCGGGQGIGSRHDHSMTRQRWPATILLIVPAV